MKLADLYPYVLPHVIGMPLPMVDLYIRQAARTFFLGTNCWQVSLDAFTFQEGTDEYDLGLPPGVELCKVVSVMAGEANYTNAVKVFGDDTVVFDPTASPVNGAAVEVTASLTPRVGDPSKAWSLPADLDRFVPDIALGALALALATVSGRNTDAADYMAKFARSINSNGIRESRKRAGRRLGAGSPQFF